jgi:glycosyltransferase involved in cell wall biosynthesis
MRIIIISGTAPPEPVTAGRVSWDLANHLAGDKNEVWLISPKPSRPLDIKYPRLPGIRINKISDYFQHININSFTYPKYNIFWRAYESLDFGIKSINYINRRIKDYDLIYASPWPFFSQLMIVVLRKNKKVPLIMNVQDLYPESFFIKIKSKALLKIFRPLYLIDKIIAKKSTHITVISESLRQAYIEKRKICGSKISVIHNWQDHEEFNSTIVPKENILTKFNLSDTTGKFIYMYLGNIGPVAGVETILYSFSKLKNNNKSYLIIAGSGSGKARCQVLAKRLNLTNLVFLEVPSGLKPVVELQSISDILLLPINPEAAISSIPSKLIAYMLSGKPIITSATPVSETALAIKSSSCGWITRTNETTEWINAMELAYNTEKTTLYAMGKSGFDYAIQNYSRAEGLKRMGSLIFNIKMGSINKAF